MDKPGNESDIPVKARPVWRFVSDPTLISLLAVLIVFSATWTWAHFQRRCSVLYFSTTRCWVVDFQPRGICLAVAQYDRTPSLGKPGDGLHYILHAGDLFTKGPFSSEKNARMGFASGSWYDHGYGGNTSFVQMPYWPVCVILALLAAWRIHLRRRRMFGPGQCQRCGYDLRATPQRCPECGLPVEAPST